VWPGIFVLGKVVYRLRGKKQKNKAKYKFEIIRNSKQHPQFIARILK
jgi:hypothetical protein